jgi:hypothetical protein
VSPEYRQVVASPTLWEQPPPTLKPSAGSSRWQGFVVVVARPLWGLRVEIGVGLLALLVWRALSARLGGTWAGAVVAACALAGSRSPGLRRFVRGLFHRARLRRRWMLGVRHAGLANHSDRVPKLVKVRAVAAGDEVRVRVPAGSSVEMLAEQVDRIAAYLGAREVRVARDRANARYGLVSVVWRDPLAGGPPLPWPGVARLRASLWDANAVGVDENGEVVSIRIVWRHVLLGGEPGAGKSVAIMLFVAWAALDPSVRLWLFDGKLVELAVWRGCAERFVGPDLAEANAALRELRAEMDRRYQWLLSVGKRQVGPDDGMGLHLVVIDELAWYLTGEKKQAQEFETQLRDLVARGRAAGIIVVAATQKPAHDTVPTSIRDLFGFRWALRCSTREASDTILGSGWATQGYSAASIDAGDRGVGYLRHEGGTPVRMKGFYLSDDDLAQLAARAEALRKTETPGLRLVEGE